MKDKQVHIARKTQEYPKLTVIGVPTNSSGKSDCVAKAPSALRSAGLIQALSHYCEVFDEGDQTFTGPTTDRDPRSTTTSSKSTLSKFFRVYELS